MPGTSQTQPKGVVSGAQSRTNADKLFDYLVSQGATPAGAAGVVGNLQGESGINHTYEAAEEQDSVKFPVAPGPK